VIFLVLDPAGHSGNSPVVATVALERGAELELYTAFDEKPADTQKNVLVKVLRRIFITEKHN